MRFCSFFALFFLPILLPAQPPLPRAPSNYVTDAANVLSSSQQSALNSKLRSFEDSTSNQIFVYIDSSLKGNEISQLCQNIFHSWKIGSKGKNNGLLIAVFVKDHQFRIHTGYGMEGQLPDLLTKKIQDNTMRPYFKKNDFYTGLDKGIDKLIYYNRHEYTGDMPDSSAAGQPVINQSETITEAEPDSNGWLILPIGWLVNIILFGLMLWRLKVQYADNPIGKTIWLVFGTISVLLPCVGAVGLFVILLMLLAKRPGNSQSESSSTWSSSDSFSSSFDSSSDSSSDFSGGGGGDSGGGGSSSDW